MYRGFKKSIREIGEKYKQGITLTPDDMKQLNELKEEKKATKEIKKACERKHPEWRKQKATATEMF